MIRWCSIVVCVLQVYTALYAVLGAVQGMGYTYLSSCLSTIEKQFGIKSQEAALVFSGNEISQIPFIFFLPFFLKLLDMLTLWREGVGELKHIASIAVIYLN